MLAAESGLNEAMRSAHGFAVDTLAGMACDGLSAMTPETIKAGTG